MYHILLWELIMAVTD